MPEFGELDLELHLQGERILRVEAQGSLVGTVIQTRVAPDVSRLSVLCSMLLCLHNVVDLFDQEAALPEIWRVELPRLWELLVETNDLLLLEALTMQENDIEPEDDDDEAAAAK